MYTGVVGKAACVCISVLKGLRSVMASVNRRSSWSNKTLVDRFSEQSDSSPQSSRLEGMI